MSAEFDCLLRGGRAAVGATRAPAPRRRCRLFYSIRSKRRLMEQLDYNRLFRWFVGLEMDEPVWTPTVFTNDRDPC